MHIIRVRNCQLRRRRHNRSNANMRYAKRVALTDATLNVNEPGGGGGRAHAMPWRELVLPVAHNAPSARVSASCQRGNEVQWAGRSDLEQFIVLLRTSHSPRTLRSSALDQGAFVRTGHCTACTIRRARSSTHTVARNQQHAACSRQHAHMSSTSRFHTDVPLSSQLPSSKHVPRTQQHAQHHVRARAAAAARRRPHLADRGHRAK